MYIQQDVRVGFLIQKKSGVPEPMKFAHSHRFLNEIVLVLCGESEVHAENTTKHGCGSYAIFYPVAMAHRQENTQGSPYERYRILYADSMLSGHIPNNRMLKHFCVIPLDDKSLHYLCKYAELLCELYSAPPSEEKDFAMKNLLATIVHTISLVSDSLLTDGTETKQSKPDANTLVRRICIYLRNNLQNDISLADVAQQFSIGRSTLIRVFKATTGMTVNQFIRTERITKASKMINQGYPLKEIAWQCGFSRVSYFCRVFTRETNKTPGQYRRDCEANREKI